MSQRSAPPPLSTPLHGTIKGTFLSRLTTVFLQNLLEVRRFWFLDVDAMNSHSSPWYKWTACDEKEIFRQVRAGNRRLTRDLAKFSNADLAEKACSERRASFAKGLLERISRILLTRRCASAGEPASLQVLDSALTKIHGMPKDRIMATHDNLTTSILETFATTLRQIRPGDDLLIEQLEKALLDETHRTGKTLHERLLKIAEEHHEITSSQPTLA